MLLRDLEDAKRAFGGVKGSFAGVGITAFSRIVPHYFLDAYPVLCLRRTRDLPILRKNMPVLCLEEALGECPKDQGLTSYGVLSRPHARTFLGRRPRPLHLFPYQSYPELEAMAEQEGWRLLAGPASMRIRTGSRAFFETMAKDLHLPRIPGRIHSIDTIRAREYGEWARALGPRFVVQLPEVVQGGGRGTFFIGAEEDYEQLRGRLSQGVWRGIPLKSVSVHQRVEGVPASVSLCVTRHGVLFSGLQQQLTDLGYTSGLPEQGIFCGHVWDEGLWPPAVEQTARAQAGRIGEYLRALGYKGIAGVDFMVGEDTGAIYPIEINPRLTGAFPMHSLLCMDRGILPMEVFHLLEFMDVSYRIDPEALNRRYALPGRGSHVILFLLTPGGRPAAGGGLASGLYQYEEETNGIRRLKDAFEYREIRNDHEFILIDGPPDVRAGVFPSPDPLYRLCRILFSCRAANKAGELALWTRRAIESVYNGIVAPVKP